VLGRLAISGLQVYTPGTLSAITIAVKTILSSLLTPRNNLLAIRLAARANRPREH
jgi:hypothetical protein